MTETSFNHAEQLVERALARTGPNPLLLATGAQIAFGLHDMGLRPTAETLHRGNALATQALELDPDLAEAHVAKGLIAWRRFESPTTVRHLLRAVELDPGNAMASWAAGYVLAEVGRTEEAREHADRARALDPLFWPAPAGRFFADLFDGRFDSALATVKTMRAVSGDHNPAANLWLGVALIYLGRADEAADLLAGVRAADAGGFSIIGSFLEAWARGDRERMHEVLGEPSKRQVIEIDKELSFLAAVGFASVGDSDESLEWLSRTIEMGIVHHRCFAENDPFLAKLRGDPRFEALIARAREMQREIEAEA